ncbi:MAG: putative DNA ligase-like protein [Pelotomaculum sp. PtaB.Bin104]|nr:MAG: putative DNA ligase-like protein [Pelotomaculum sp. PtaB.Bin104]
MDQKNLPLLRPMLAVSAEPFSSDEYLYEIKWDGYRSLAYLDGGTMLRSRNLAELNSKFPELVGLHQRIKRKPAIVDGEIVVLENGKPSFTGLQSRGRHYDRPAVFIIFDVLYADGKPVMDLPLLARKNILQDMVSPGAEVILSQFVLHDGIEFYNACVDERLEGAVAKKLTGLYLPGRRSSAWKKFRHTKEADLAICGYQPGRAGQGIGSLVLGGNRDGRLVYQGKVGTGLSNREIELLLAKLTRIAAQKATLEVPKEERGRTRWVRPLLVCSVNYLTITAGGCLRHPVYRGLRVDKSPEECPAVQ